jgi:hypothetical protein
MNEVIDVEAKSVDEIIPPKPRYEPWHVIHLTKSMRKGKSVEELNILRKEIWDAQSEQRQIRDNWFNEKIKQQKEKEHKGE